MKILMLGGTVFLGRHLVEAALVRGHTVTLFNRGRHNPHLFPELEKLRGDREGDIEALRGGDWDAAIDTCGHLPRVAETAAVALAESVQHYTFISSLLVYKDLIRKPGIDESYPVSTLGDPSPERVSPETIGPLKAACERVVGQAIPEQLLVIRPGVIVGPHDPTDRFTYWPHRIAQGGEVLVPWQQDLRVQIIDVRDLAGWIIRMVESFQTGFYNASGPDYPLTLPQLVEVCRDVIKTDATFTWVDEAYLVQLGIGRGRTMELPLWMPNAPGAARVNCSKAIAAGLTFRALEDTVRDTLNWDTTRPQETVRRAGLERKREADLLRSWYAQAQVS